MFVGITKLDGEDQDPAGDEGDDDGADDAPRSGQVGVLRLLRHVRRGVVSGEGVLRHQEADRRNTYHLEQKPERLMEPGEHKRGRGVVARHEDEHSGDDRYAEYVPPGRDVGEEGDDAARRRC